MKVRHVLLGAASIAVLAFFCGLGWRTYDLHQRKACHEAKMEAAKTFFYLKKRNEGLRQMQMVANKYPFDPQIPFVQGLAYHMVGNSKKCKECMRKSCKMYDDRYKKDGDKGDAINAAFACKFAYGEHAARKRLDACEADSSWYEDICVPNDSLMDKLALSLFGNFVSMRDFGQYANDFFDNRSHQKKPYRDD